MAAAAADGVLYPAALTAGPDGLIADTLAVFRGTVEDYLQGTAPALVAARFHQSLAQLLAAACVRVREESRLGTVALSGGVMQNALIFNGLKGRLEEQGFEVLTHRLTPPNDGSISLGQVAVAAARLARGSGF
jgi:hydrogenase maturation protein HypF